MKFTFEISVFSKNQSTNFATCKSIEHAVAIGYALAVSSAPCVPDDLEYSIHIWATPAVAKNRYSSDGSFSAGYFSRRDPHGRNREELQRAVIKAKEKITAFVKKTRELRKTINRKCRFLKKHELHRFGYWNDPTFSKALTEENFESALQRAQELGWVKPALPPQPSIETVS